MAQIDGRYILVESEEPDYPVEVTTQPVEKGINLVDHVQRMARTLALSGYIVGPTAAATLDYLIKAKDSGTVVKFTGRTLFNGLITALSSTHDYTVADGLAFTAALMEVRVANSSFVATLPVPVKAQAAKIVNSGIKQTKSQTTKASTGKEKVEKVKFVKGSPWA